MKNLLPNIQKWRGRLAHDPLAVFLDYDGTLSAIASTPSEATLPLATRETLRALSRLKNVKVGIVSGRGLSDLKRLVTVKGLSYVGSHGVEFQSKGVAFKYVPKSYLRILKGFKDRFKLEFADLQGVLLEVKPFSLAVHYRLANSNVEKRVKQIVKHVCADAINKNIVVLMLGKKVVEIMPSTAMDKGRAVLELLKRWGKKKYLPIYIGDDTTDEAAFRVLRDQGLTVKVGITNKSSKAHYFLNGVEDVRMFLELIIYFRVLKEETKPR